MSREQLCAIERTARDERFEVSSHDLVDPTVMVSLRIGIRSTPRLRQTEKPLTERLDPAADERGVRKCGNGPLGRLISSSLAEELGFDRFALVYSQRIERLGQAVDQPVADDTLVGNRLAASQLDLRAGRRRRERAGHHPVAEDVELGLGQDYLIHRLILDAGFTADRSVGPTPVRDKPSHCRILSREKEAGHAPHDQAGSKSAARILRISASCRAIVRRAQPSCSAIASVV